MNVEEMLDLSVVKVFEDGSRRAYYRSTPLGRRVQGPGPYCADGEHDLIKERYPRCRSANSNARRWYTDLVCRKCPRRIPK